MDRGQLGREAEAAFLVGFWNQWLKEHGTPFPEAT